MHGYPGRLGSGLLLLRPTYRTGRSLMTCQIAFIIMSKVEKIYPSTSLNFMQLQGSED